MNTIKILEDDIKDIKIAALPTRPTADESLGGNGLSPEEMKAAFDKLPLYIIEHFNSLVDVLFAEGNDLAATITTGLGSEHTLRDLLSDIASGLFADYLSTGSLSLNARLAAMEKRISTLEGKDNYASGI